MADVPDFATPAGEPDLVPICPWCSAALPAADAAVCPSCGAHLTGVSDMDIPGVTTVDPVMLAAAAAPRKIKRSLGSLLVGNDDEIPPPSEAEMPALARPDADVRREILRLEMDAQLASLKAEVAARNAEAALPLRDASPEPAPEAVLEGAPEPAPEAALEGAPEPPPEAAPEAAPDPGEPPGRG